VQMSLVLKIKFSMDGRNIFTCRLIQRLS